MKNVPRFSASLLSQFILGAAIIASACPATAQTAPQSAAQAVSQTAPIIEVVFDKPEAFVDAYPRGRNGSEEELRETLDNIRLIFSELGARQLKPGDRLKITITELDLAGEIEPGRSGILELRVLRRISWPSMTLRYSLQREGRETAAETKLSDPSYQDNAGFCARAGGFCYERLMVRRWMQREFG